MKTSTEMSHSTSIPSRSPSLPQESSSNRQRSFPRKLFQMLEDAESMNFNDIVTWQPDGKSFKVIQPRKFAATIMHQYFNQSRYKSFQRQLNIYGFQRTHYGPNKGSYSHPCLQKDKPQLCRQIARVPNKQQQTTKEDKKRPTALSSAQQEPQSSLKILLSEDDSKFVSRSPIEGKGPLHDMMLLGPQLPRERPLCVYDTNEIDASEADMLVDFFQDWNQVPLEDIPQNGSSRSVFGRSSKAGNTSVKPGATTRPNHHEDLSLLDIDNDVFAPLLLKDEEEGDAAPSQEQQVSPTSCSENVFPRTLHILLDNAKRDGYQHIVSWVQDGAAFKVHDSDAFVTKVMPTYFDQTKYESFRRQLNMYGFSRVSRGENRGAYFHELFLESDHALCRNITRSQASTLSNNKQQAVVAM